MLGFFHRMLGRHVPCHHRRQHCGVVAIGVVQPFFIDRQKTGEPHHLPGGAQRRLASAIHQIDGGPLQPRRRHLACHRALVDQFVEASMIARPVLVARKIGGADRLMRFLRVLCFGLVHAWFFGQISAVIPVCNGLPGR